jgi:hypothetical protein
VQPKFLFDHVRLKPAIATGLLARDRHIERARKARLAARSVLTSTQCALRSCDARHARERPDLDWDTSSQKLDERLESLQTARLDGGEGRTRTFEAMRRLIYSQLPLPLGTLPRLRPIANLPARRWQQPVDELESQIASSKPRPGAFMSEGRRQSQPSLSPERPTFSGLHQIAL